MTQTAVYLHTVDKLWLVQVLALVHCSTVTEFITCVLCLSMITTLQSTVWR